MPLSNAPGATRALYDGLRTATYPEPQPAVWNGQRNIDANLHDNIYVQPDPGSPVRVDQEWLGFGAGAQRRETIAIPIEIIVFREGADPTAAEDRAWALAAAVAAVLAADQSLGGHVLSALPEGMTSSVEVDGDGRFAVITLTVTCEARVSGI